MKIAALGDIHSNHFALEACLNDIERIGVDGIAFLGDYVSDCPCPQKTLALLRRAAQRYPTWFVRGNREEYMLNHEQDPDDGWQYNSQSGSLFYTYENLTEEDLRWFESMPVSMKVDFDGVPSFEICHGSIDKTRVLVWPGSSEMDRAHDLMQTELFLGAHCHVAYTSRYRGKLFVNGGAAGIPTFHETTARYALLEYRAGEWTPRLMRVKYDVQAAVREFHESGFMEKAKVWARAMAATLVTGIDYADECIYRVGELSRISGMPFDAEALWEKVAEELGI